MAVFGAVVEITLRPATHLSYQTDTILFRRALISHLLNCRGLLLEIRLERGLVSQIRRTDLRHSDPGILVRPCDLRRLHEGFCALSCRALPIGVKRASAWIGESCFALGSPTGLTPRLDPISLLSSR